MKCPNCNVPLSMADRQGIEIDYCPQCRGVWLDRGELDKIIERSSAETAPPPAAAPPVHGHAPSHSPRHGHYRDDDYYKHKRKKNLLGELFDF
ncbi:MAG TPA: zf-TFIIB domain-containing protein [Lysobacter sp.]|nr:zf-TFIIB domain-containing protein [Lysobacter sp.]